MRADRWLRAGLAVALLALAWMIHQSNRSQARQAEALRVDLARELSAMRSEITNQALADIRSRVELTEARVIVLEKSVARFEAGALAGP
jgi:sensor domain CHASE-containing protein